MERGTVRVKVILNPWADRGRAAEFEVPIARWGSRFGKIEVNLTEAPGEAIALAAGAVREGYDVVAAAGGDGTVNEVVNGLLAGAGRESREGPAFGLIPIGSGNDYAHGLALMDPPEVAVRRLFLGEKRRLDVAEVVDGEGRRRFACNGIGIGIDAAIAIENVKIRRLYGFPAYMLATVRTILFKYETPQLAVRFDDEMVSQGALLLAVGVGPRVGGGFRITPDARFDDGLLDSCLVDPVGRATMLAMLLRVMRGTHVSASFVEMRRNERIQIDADRPLPIHVDGEIFATTADKVRTVTLTCRPDYLALMS